MKVKELKKQLENISDEIEVFVRCCFNPCGNIIEAESANKDTYGSFGENVDCIIIEPDHGG